MYNENSVYLSTYRLCKFDIGTGASELQPNNSISSGGPLRYVIEKPTLYGIIPLCKKQELNLSR